jgi:hypothetical protein
MKKIIVFSIAILLVVLLSFSVMSFRDNDPKKKNTECTTSAKCDKNKDNAACQKSESGSCCEKKCDNSSADDTKKCEGETEGK